MKHTLTASACLLLALLACEDAATAKPSPRADAVPVASEAAQQTFALLTAELAAALEQGGPVAAIPVCAVRAGEITREVAARKKVDIVRLSDRPRNPAQEATGEDLAAIGQFRAEILAGRELRPSVKAAPDRTTTVRIPIVITQPLCLQCHGNDDDVAAATREAIARSYPNDRARGYSLNDLRGIWKITLSVESQP
ncbi:MAG: Tll0287-like domain-containing protein [Luteolibacter sp.]